MPDTSPITIIDGVGALRDYEKRGDPGDRGLVVAGMALSVLSIVGWLGFILWVFVVK